MNLQIAPLEQGLSLKARVYTSLKTLIAGLNIYDTDSDLRFDERDLSQRFGISRTPLREAIAQLDQEGLVKIVPRRGIFVVRKTKAEILDMITVWAALESMAARLAAKKASDADIGAMRCFVNGFEVHGSAQQVSEYSDVNIQFHKAVIKLGSCALISEVSNGLFMHVRAIRHRAIFDQDRAQQSVVDHKNIISALVARDADGAERLVRDHTLKLRDHVKRHVDLD